MSKKSHKLFQTGFVIKKVTISTKHFQGFFCLSGGDDPLVDTDTGMWQGCEIECEDDEVRRKAKNYFATNLLKILVVDPHNGGQWECHKTNEDTRPLLCPGKFNTGPKS